MAFYTNHVLPHLINLGMRNPDLRSYRQRVASAAVGRVIEIGIGSGLNLPFYTSNVSEILGLEPAPRLRALAQRAALDCSITTNLIDGVAEQIPLADSSVDTVVTTWTLCSVRDPTAALREMRRVLNPKGQLLFAEHGQAPQERIRKWQDRLTPAWRLIGGGCHLNRPIRSLIESVGFSIALLDTGYLRRPGPMTYMYVGRAHPD